jgi:hypothetical protein
MQLAVVITMQWAAFHWVQQMPWFEPYNSTTVDMENSSKACFENYALFSVSSMQYIILAVVFSKGAPYRKSIFSNCGFSASLVFLTGFTLYLILDPAEWLRENFELKVPTAVDFRLMMVMLVFVNAVVAMFIEYFIVDYLIFKKLRYRFHNVDKSHKKYLAVERSLQHSHHWPPITKEVVTDIQPDIPQKLLCSSATASIATVHVEFPHREVALNASVLLPPKRRHHSECFDDHQVTVFKNATLPRCGLNPATAVMNSVSKPKMNLSVPDVQ